MLKGRRLWTFMRYSRGLGIVIAAFFILCLVGEEGQVISLPVISINIDDLRALVEYRLASLGEMIDRLPSPARACLTHELQNLKRAFSERDYERAFTYASFLASILESPLLVKKYLTNFQMDLLRSGLLLIEDAISMLFALETRQKSWICVGEYREEGGETLIIWPQISSGPQCPMLGADCQPGTYICRYSLVNCECFESTIKP